MSTIVSIHPEEYGYDMNPFADFYNLMNFTKLKIETKNNWYLECITHILYFGVNKNLTLIWFLLWHYDIDSDG